MSDFCRRMPRNTQCEPTPIGTGETHGCEPFDVCLGFGRSLHYDGGCFSVQGEPTVADGEYGVIVVQNGCIVGARPNPAFEYTPDPCAPSANPCGGSGDSSLSLDPDTRNLLSFDAAGRLGAFLTVEPGSGVNVTGSGTSADPLVISMAAQEPQKTYISTKDAEALSVEGSGSVSDPYVIGLAESGVTAGTYNGFTIDAYGRITKYEKPSTSSINSIVEGPGISISSEESTGVVTISLAASGLQSDTLQLGGFEVKLDLSGRVTGATQNITVGEQTFDPYDMNISVNDLGSIIGLTPVIRLARGHVVSNVGPTQTISVNITTDRRGYLYVCWRGYEVVSNIADGTIGKYTDAVSNNISALVNNQNGFTNIIGKYDKKYTVQSNSGTGGSTYTITGMESAIVEWRGRSSDMYDPGTYTVTITKTGTDPNPMYNNSVVEVYLVQ